MQHPISNEPIEGIFYPLQTIMEELWGKNRLYYQGRATHSSAFKLSFRHIVSGTFFPHFFVSFSHVVQSWPLQVVHPPLYFEKRACTFHYKCCLSLKRDSNKHVWMIVRVFAAGHGHRWRGFHLRCSCGFWCMTWKTIQYCYGWWDSTEKLLSYAVMTYRMPNNPFSNSSLTFD